MPGSVIRPPSALGSGKVLCVCSLQPEMPGDPTPKVLKVIKAPCAARGKDAEKMNPEAGF